MPSPDPFVVFLYSLIRDHVPSGGVAAAIEQARAVASTDADLTFTAPELEQLAQRYADELRSLSLPPATDLRDELAELEPAAEPSPDETRALADDALGIQPIPALRFGIKRTAKEAIMLAFAANPGWLKAKHIAASVGEGRSKHALRFAIQELVAEGKLNARGATASRAYRRMSDCIAGATQGSTDQHADSAETSPPRSPSEGDADESPDGEEGRSAVSVAAVPSSPDLEDAEPWVPHRPTPKPERAPMNVTAVVGEIEPWVLRQQTFRKRQVVEAFPGFEADEIRAALIAIGNEGKLRVEQVDAGEPMYSVVGREDRGSASKPAQGSTGTVEGAVMSFIQSRGSTGASKSAVAIAARCSNDEAATTLAKLSAEGDIRTINDGDVPDGFLYVAA